MRNQHKKNDEYKTSTGLKIIAPKQQTQKDKDRMSRISSLMARTQRIQMSKIDLYKDDCYVK